MTLRNAFAGLATETTLNTVKTTLANMLALLPTTLSSAGNLLIKVAESLPAGTNIIGKVGIDTTNGAIPISLDISSLAKDTNIQINSDLIDALYSIATKLNVFGVARAADGSLRINTANQTLPTVTTVGTVTNQSQLGTYAANTLVMSMQNMSSKSNINNCVG